MTKREAIRECKKLWKEIEKSGLTKEGFFATAMSNKWRVKSYHSECPLCQYSKVIKGVGCRPCPLTEQYDKSCFELGYFKDTRHSKFFTAIRGLK